MCEQWIPAPFPNGPGYEAILEYAMFNSTDAIQSTRLNNIACTLYGDNQTLEMSNSYIPPWGWSFYTLVSGVTRHQCAKPHPREGYNYYVTCYLGNITVQERYGQHS